jgi:hypothetical protein
MKNSDYANRIYWIEAIGFSMIIALAWANESIGLPGIIWGGPEAPNWHEAVLETCITSLVWLAVHIVTRKLMTRLRYLEEFLRVCAWCRKIGFKSEWIPMEEYFDRHLATKTSHGICPECARKLSNGIPNA